MKKFLILFFTLISILGYSETIELHIGSELSRVKPNFKNLITKAINQAGHDIIIIEKIPIERAEKLLLDRQLDIYFKVPEHSNEQNIAVPIKIPLALIKIRVFVNNKVGAKTLSDLQGKRFASVRGLSINEYVIKSIPNIKIYNDLKDFPKVLEFVKEGRADFFIQQIDIGNYFIKQAGLEGKISMIDEILADIPVWMYIHKDKIYLVDSIKPILESMVEEGEF